MSILGDVKAKRTIEMRNLKIKKHILNSVTVKQRMVDRYVEAWQKRRVPGHEDRYIPFTDEEVEHIRLLNDRLATLTIATLEQASRICDDLMQKVEHGNKDYEGFKLKAFIKMNGHQFMLDDPNEMLLRIQYAKKFELAELDMNYSQEDRHALLDRLTNTLAENTEQMICWEYSQLHDICGIRFCEAFHWFTDVCSLFPLEDIMLLQPDNFESNIEINI